ncbi:response regulator receiver and PAS/PAC sensor-containing signal transduction diguanylate cyclase/phosphodiesterase [Oleiphilus messinensis]|uniref:Response regulator receiver and PAS/PAC sensor-containing signal transduction diguanylate cyclase/phosphodiesterase n=1 Tax=Oleiphilus messinensis TaxID=141451 RepID=A0A1Y0IH38_9GAMM|nr:EAL domain-containing protein [Oleiphilus messinensis]ARU58845.1 response regulator receiver and PAS/PAC sensor-containing signal transduction diguanylate cyclase/phosphodiesterase [Oleiphilus messinensis]
MLETQYTKSPTSNSGERSAPRPKILIVDDRPENHRSIERVLAQAGAQIYNALDGNEALSLTLRHHFAVVLLDVMMPVMDGFETAALMRINDDSKTTPIIFITAADYSVDFEFKGYELGAVDYLFKPIQPHSLASKVKVFIELERQRYQLKQSLEDIQRLENRNKLLLNSIGEGIIGLNDQGEITFINPATEKLLDQSERGLLGNSILSVMYAGDSDANEVSWTDTEIFRACSRGEPHHEEIGVFWHRAERLFPVEFTATPLEDDGKFIGVVIAFQDITQRRKTEEQLAHLAQYDSLTGLYNRYAFTSMLQQGIARASRSGQPLALLFLDLDQFKQVNDNLGHEIGDCLLQEVAQRLSSCVRDGDVISRFGGDEFTIILESFNCRSAHNAAIVCDKLLSILSDPFRIRGNSIRIAASIGIGIFPQSADSAEALMRCADLAMYRAKKLGRNTYQFFTDEMQQEAQETLEMESRIRNAIEHYEFELFYQPKIDIETETVVGAEALLRWRDEKGHFISPELFVPKLEEMGLIEKVGAWVLEAACQQIRDWQGGGLPADFKLAVNLSVRQLTESGVAGTLKGLLDRFGLAGTRLELEITESIMLMDSAAMIDELRAIHDLGVDLSVDDFGTGYSSLGYLHALPLNALKIDKSFTLKVNQDEDTQKIVHAIVSLARSLNLHVTAEGVETRPQLEFMKKIGCHTVQGFLFSPAIPASDFTQLIQQGSRSANH